MFFSIILKRGAVLKYSVAILVVLLLTAACGRETGSESGPVQVVFWHAMGGPLGDVLEDSLIAEFNLLHDDIEIVPVCMGNYSALSQKIMAGVMADSPPAMAQAYETWTAQLIRGGALVPLDSLIDADSTFTDEMWDDFFPVFKANNTFLMTLAKLSSIEVIDSEFTEPASTALIGEMELLIPLKGLVDVAQESARLSKEIEKLSKDAKRYQAKLGNAKFVDNAPAEVVVEEKRRLNEVETAMKNLQAKLVQIQNL